MNTTATGLCARNVTLHRARRAVIHAVSAHISRGEVLGILGPNGTGKSSLLQALAGVLPLHSGQVDLDGRALGDWPSLQRARRIALLPQGRDCAWPIVARELVLLGRLPHRAAWAAVSAADEAAVATALQATDAAAFAQRAVDTLSTGELARVLLARALATGADYLLADEPTAGLDPAATLRVCELLKAQSRAGCGVVVVMHELTLAARHCDRLLLLHEGALLAEGTPAQVLTTPNLATVYGIAAHLGEDAAGALITPFATLDAH